MTAWCMHFAASGLPVLLAGVFLAGCGEQLFDHDAIEVCDQRLQPVHVTALPIASDDGTGLVVSCNGPGRGALELYLLDLAGKASRVDVLDFDQNVSSTVVFQQPDGPPGLLAVLSTGQERGVALMAIDTEGGFDEPASIHATGGELGRIVVSDIDRDGVLDLVAPEVDLWLQNTGGVARPGPFEAHPIHPDGEWRRIYGHVADLDGNGHPDAAYVFHHRGVIRLYRDHAPAPEEIPADDVVDKIHQILGGGDINDDGHIDLVIATQPSPTERSVRLLLSERNGRWNLSESLPALADAETVVTGVFTGNGHPDLLAAPRAEPGRDDYALTLLAGEGNGQFGRARQIDIPGFPYRMMTTRIGNTPVIAYVDMENRLLHLLTADPTRILHGD